MINNLNQAYTTNGPVWPVKSIGNNIYFLKTVIVWMLKIKWYHQQWIFNSAMLMSVYTWWHGSKNSQQSTFLLFGTQLCDPRNRTNIHVIWVWEEGAHRLLLVTWWHGVALCLTTLAVRRSSTHHLNYALCNTPLMIYINCCCFGTMAPSSESYYTKV